MKNKSIKEQFDELLTYTNAEEQLEHDAQMLAFQFLSKIDKVMADRNISKKELAQKVGTSASFITQMFRGDRKPNWNILAKLQRELDLDFKIVLKDEIDDAINKKIIDYHRKWTKTREYERRRGIEALPEVIMNIEENKYQPALAG
jgi:transcriptional regulator with XRE-family HTH domain